jgi:hypothetical protein
MEKKVFEYQFKAYQGDVITKERNEDDKIYFEMVDDVPVIFLKKETCITLAKLLIQMGLNNYSNDFHIHIEENMDTNNKDIFRFQKIE